MVIKKTEQEKKPFITQPEQKKNKTLEFRAGCKVNVTEQFVSKEQKCNN